MKKQKIWVTVRDYLYVLVGALVQALAMRFFLVPALLSSGGISGLAQIINFYTAWPIGVMTIIGNLPIFVIGWRYLGGWHFASRTIVSILAFSVFTDLLVAFTPDSGVTKDIVLDCIYGGIILGVGLGLVYRGRGTSGGTDVLVRMLRKYVNMPMSQGYLITDGLVIFLSGLAFGWDKALYGLVVIYVSGIATENISEGFAAFRSAMIVSNCPRELASKITGTLSRGVTILEGTGAYTGAERPVLYCVVSRSEVHQLKAIVNDNDPTAFMVIGEAHEVLGEGFKPLIEA